MKKRKEKLKYVARPGIEPRTPDLRVRCLTDWATRPGFYRLYDFLYYRWYDSLYYLYYRLFDSLSYRLCDSYRRMEDPACLEIDAGGTVDEVSALAQKVLEQHGIQLNQGNE